MASRDQCSQPSSAGTFTHAAEQMSITQPTLSQQIRRLEEIVGTPPLQRRPEGARLTRAGSVLLEGSRAVLSLVDHGVSRIRQAEGLGRPHLRFALPAVPARGSRRRRRVAAATSAAAAAEVDVAWIATMRPDQDTNPGRAGLGRRDGCCGAGRLAVRDRNPHRNSR
jgi:DNA-binding transcriptional LysR family regulator